MVGASWSKSKTATALLTSAALLGPCSRARAAMSSDCSGATPKMKAPWASATPVATTVSVASSSSKVSPVVAPHTWT